MGTRNLILSLESKLNVALMDFLGGDTISARVGGRGKGREAGGGAVSRGRRGWHSHGS